jgi:cytosine/adenosine deaminase-related metal-dependent hydrolase
MKETSMWINEQMKLKWVQLVREFYKEDSHLHIHCHENLKSHQEILC